MARKVTQEQVLEAIKGTQGIITKVAKRLESITGEKWSWTTTHDYVVKWEATKKAIADETSFIADIVDQKIYEAILQGDMQTIKWYATLKMKDRGYDPAATLKLAGSDPLNIHFDGMTQEDLLNADNVEIGGVDGE